MLLFGHLGIGSRLGALALRGEAVAQTAALLLGTVLPDVIDKPLYYGLAAATGRHGAALGLISCTRTVGHTALLGVLLWLGLRARGRPAAGAALFAGLASHWLLDLATDGAFALEAAAGFGAGAAGYPLEGPSTLATVLFPLLGTRFPVMPFASLAEHVGALGDAWSLGCELVGGLLLWRWLRPPRLRRPGGRR